MDQLLDSVVSINSFLSGVVLIIALVGAGIYFSFRLGFVQVTMLPRALKQVFGGMKFGEKAGKDGMSSFQALATAVAAQVGTGNLAGAATAIAAGGPGAIFWMWISALFGMATIYAEATAAQKFRHTTEDGEVLGGPVYYIKAGIKGKAGEVLAVIFAIFIILALGLFGIMVQSNSIGSSFQSAFGVNPLIIGVIVAIVVVIIALGGVSSIASVTEKLVPIMAGFYIIGSLFILITHIGAIPEVFREIFVGAFNPAAVMGGVAGATVKQAIRYGVARGLFSNEAGMGSTPHSHALAKVNHPCEQGLTAIVGVFIDTFIVLNLTAFVVIMAGTWKNPDLAGINITQTAFVNYFGNMGNIFIAICMLFFAFSTIIGWYFFAQLNVKYLTKNSDMAIKVFTVIVAVFVVVGSVLKVDLVWELSDMFNSLMVIPNIIGLLAVSNIVVDLHKEFKSK